jgi:hypothetical protein
MRSGSESPARSSITPRAGSLPGVLRALSIVLAVAVLGLAAPAAADAERFQSPTRNIGCALTKSGVRCDIRQRAWRPPPKPRSCDVDFGQGLFLGRRGPARFVCAGDTALGVGSVLAYGDAIRRGRFRCASLVTGMRCINRRNDHGFFLSRARVRWF